MSTGNYYRWNLFNERKRYFAALAQSSMDGNPCYLLDSDMTDLTRIVQRGIQRLAQVGVDGSVGPTAWDLAHNVEDEENNFLITGGGGTDETAAATWVGGLRATLYASTDYKCMNSGAFNVADADAIHRRYSSVASGTLVDEHANYRPHALIGLKVQVGGAGEFTVSENTETTLTLTGFDPGVLTFTHLYYYIALTPPPADAVQTVYLDVHLEDWGMEEDSDLNQNPGGTAIEAMRRLKLVQTVWVDQRTETNPNDPIITFTTNSDGRLTYVDPAETRHYVFKLGEITRRAEDDAILADDINSAHEDEAGSPPEVVAARAFSACLPIDGNADNQQPDNLRERLLRGDSFVTVGDGTTSTGMFNGPAGLQAAINCRPAKIFLKRGIYNFAGLGTLTVSAGVHIVGESALGSIIFVDTTIGAAPGVLLGQGTSLEHVVLNRGVSEATGPLVQFNGLDACISKCRIQDLTHTGCAVLFYAAGGTGDCRLVDSRITKANRTAIRVSRTADAPPESLGYVSYDGYPLDHAGLHIDRCHVITTSCTSGHPAVHLGAGAACYLTNCIISAAGEIIVAEGAHIGDAATPASFLGRDLHFISHNLLFGLSGAGVAGMARVRLKPSNVLFDGNVIDCANATAAEQLPGYGVYVQSTGAAVGSSRIVNNYIRGATVGIGVYGAAAFREILISGNNVVPYSSSIGNVNAIELATTGAGGGKLLVTDNYLQASYGTRNLLRMSCPAVARGNVLDGTASVMVAGAPLADAGAEDGGNPASTFAVGALVVMPDLPNSVQTVEGNLVLGLGSIGIQIDGVGCSPSAKAYITKNRILGQERSLRGIWCSASDGDVMVDGNLISHTLREGIAGPSTSNQLFVTNNEVLHPGVAVIDEFRAPAIWAHSGIRHARLISGNTVRTPGTISIYSADHSCRVVGNTTEMTTVYNSLYISGDNKHESELFVKDNICTGGAGVIVVNDAKTVEVTGNKVFPGAGGTGVSCSNCTSLRVTANHIAIPAESVAKHVVVNGCEYVDVLRNTLTSFGPSVGHTIEVQNDTTAVELTIEGNNIRKDGGKGIYANVTGTVSIQNNIVQAGFKLDDGIYDPERRSVYVQHVGQNGDVHLMSNTLHYGATVLYDMVGIGTGPVISGNTCLELGIHVRGAKARVTSNSVSRVFTSAKAHMVDASGIWCGAGNWLIADADADRLDFGDSLVVNGNTIRQVGIIGINLDAPAGILGRCAGIMVRGRGMVVSDNTVDGGNGTAIMLGWFDNPAAAAAKVGVIYNNRVANNTLYGVMAMAIGDHGFATPWQYVANNVFRISDVADCVRIYGPSAGFAGVVFRGNEAAVGMDDATGALTTTGTVRTTELVTLEVGMLVAEIGVLSTEDAIRRSNSFALGDSLD